MRIAVVSDTHGNVANFKKMVQWLNKENIKVVLHCGDIGSLESLKESLADFDGEFFGVLGNMDKDYKILIDEYNKIPRVKIKEDTLETEVEGKRIAINHLPHKAKQLAESGKYDFVFYGHTHRPWQEKMGDCQLINPGEVAGQFYKPCFAIYDTETEEVELKILEKI